MKRILSLAALAAVVLALPAWGQVIRVTAPAAGATWCIGSSYTITWTRSGTMDETVVIRLRLRGGGDTGTRLVINRTENDGSYGPWVVPADVTPGEYFIRINTTDGAVTDSSGAFNIATCSDPIPPPSGSIAVTSPGASSSWRPGSRQTIEWTGTGSLTPMAKITLRREGAPETEDPASRIADGCANNGSRVWFIPESLAEGRYFVRVRAPAPSRATAPSSPSAPPGAGSDVAGPDHADPRRPVDARRRRRVLQRQYRGLGQEQRPRQRERSRRQVPPEFPREGRRRADHHPAHHRAGRAPRSPSSSWPCTAARSPTPACARS